MYLRLSHENGSLSSLYLLSDYVARLAHKADFCLNIELLSQVTLLSACYRNYKGIPSTKKKRLSRIKTKESAYFLTI